MKKILLVAVLFVAATAANTALAGKKKDKKKDTAVAEQTLKLATPSDTTSYAAGYAATDGLLPYLINRLHVDTAYIADFERGYREAIAKSENAAFKAYLAGCTIAQQASEQILPSAGKDLVGTDDSIAAAPFHEGFVAGVKQDTTLFNTKSARELVETRASAAREARNKVYKEENEAWLKSNASKPGVVTTASGLQYKVLKEGTGAKPTKTDKVEVIYEGKTINGNVFDATSKHNGKKTDSFRCDQVIKGWTEALTSMSVGSKWEIYIPQNLAYGAREAGQIKPYSTLIFTVELVGIEEKKAETAAPAQTAEAKTTAAPAAKSTAKKTTKKTSKR